MSSRKRRNSAGRGPSGRPGSASAATGSRITPPTSAAGRLALLVAVLVLVAAVVIAADFVFGAISGGSGSAQPAAAATTSQAANASQIGIVVQGNGGHWTNVTPDQLGGMLAKKDFTFVNVKTPYIGEIAGTDLYIPYEQLAGRAAELPQNKSARILVYCRSGAESAIAAQTLLDLGYTNVWNLDGGMNAWQSSGRTLIQKSR